VNPPPRFKLSSIAVGIVALCGAFLLVGSCTSGDDSSQGSSESSGGSSGTQSGSDTNVSAGSQVTTTGAGGTPMAIDDAATTHETGSAGTSSGRDASSTRDAASAACDPGPLKCASQGNATCCTYCDCMAQYCGSWFDGGGRAACMTHCLSLREDQLCCQYSYCLASEAGPHCNHAEGDCCACPK